MSRSAAVLLILVTVLPLACSGTISPTPQPAPGKFDFSILERIPEEQRKRIYLELYENLVCTQNDADAKFKVNSRPSRSIEEDRRFRAVEMEHGKYFTEKDMDSEKAIRDKYGLTAGELGQIAAEGQTKQWPHPKRK